MRRIALVIQRVNKIVSIHAPTRGATDWRSSLWRAVSFNPRTHEGCDFPKYRSNHTILVSIHAPTRGATRVSPARRSCQRVSIHAPTRGATSLRFCAFNSSTVSIHAPTRGATLCAVVCAIQCRFQSTHPRGVRHTRKSCYIIRTKFQSTHPRGVRLGFLF